MRYNKKTPTAVGTYLTYWFWRCWPPEFNRSLVVFERDHISSTEKMVYQKAKFKLITAVGELAFFIGKDSAITNKQTVTSTNIKMGRPVKRKSRDGKYHCALAATPTPF